MKKLSICVMVAFAACVMMLTSCLDGSNAGTQTGYMYGVIGTLNLTTPVVYVYDSPWYSTQLRQDYLQANLTDGDCIFFAYEIDYGSEENADASTKGYLTASVGGWEKLSKATMFSSLQDTTQVFTSETTLFSVSLSSYFSKNIYFINPIFDEYFQGQENSYQISFDTNEGPEEINGERIYYLYLRTIVTDPGKTSSSSYKNQGPMIGVDLGTFLNYAYRQEENASKNSVFIKFKYPTAFDEDDSSITSWGVTDKVEFAIPSSY
ncbi:MAG: hypothetical protein LIP06_02095 [Tannerellaceae bacterium]|nr:hypothetical protein [Tannerellaceae bacterium]